jgi:ribonuclease R
LFIELLEHYVEGLVHVSTMGDDYYRFVEQQHVLRGENTEKAYRLGDRVRVQVVRVDMERRQVELGLVDILEAVRKEERRRAVPRSKVRPKKEARRQERRPAKRTQRAGRRERAARKNKL